MNGHGFIIRLLAALETEQMNLVVARQPLAVGAIDQQAVADFMDLRRLQRHRAAQQRNAMLPRRGRQKMLQR